MLALLPVTRISSRKLMRNAQSLLISVAISVPIAISVPVAISVSLGTFAELVALVVAHTHALAAI
jgi:hypothetical protein